MKLFFFFLSVIFCLNGCSPSPRSSGDKSLEGLNENNKPIGLLGVFNTSSSVHIFENKSSYKVGIAEKSNSKSSQYLKILDPGDCVPISFEIQKIYLFKRNKSFFSWQKISDVELILSKPNYHKITATQVKEDVTLPSGIKHTLFDFKLKAHSEEKPNFECPNQETEDLDFSGGA